MARSTTTSTPPADELPTQVLRQFRQIFNAVKTHFQQVERQAGIGGAQLWALGIVKQQPSIGVKELAARMDVKSSTASNLIRGLVERELLETARDAQDKRAVCLKLTSKGARALEASPGPFEGVLPDALKALDVASLDRLQRDLALLLAQLAASDEAAQIPLADL